MSLLILGDALEVLRSVPGESANEFVTSPPFFRQRDYGVDGQIGRERSVQEYLDRLFPVFDQAWRVLKPDGTCWVNLGDTSVKKGLQLVPWLFAEGMVKRGWILRQVIIWHKKNPKPESVKSRFTNAWEPIFFFAKNEQHFFSRQFERCCKATMKRCEAFVKRGEKFDPVRHKHDPLNARQSPMRILERVAKNLVVPGQTPHGMHVARANGDNRDVFDRRGRRNMRSVWRLAVAQCRSKHFAVWPAELVRRMIRAGCPRGGVVIDPFIGSGTSLVVAEQLGCTGIGIDISAEFLAIARQMILKARAKRAKAGEKAAKSGGRRVSRSKR